MFKRTATAFAVTAAAGLVLAGCAASDDGADDETPDAGGETTEETPDNGGETAGGEISLAVFNGWDESLVTSLLWQNILEEKGYDVTLEHGDPAVVFQGISDGDYDVVTDVWLPITHEEYLNTYGDDMEQLGTWFDAAALTIAVNADAPIDSIAEINDNADLFGNRIVGIEPGAGLTGATERTIEAYDIDIDFQTSSTPAMLSELDAAISNGENIIVTLWEPHWAYGAWDLKNLEDPEGTMGAAEDIITFARTGFTEDFPEVAGWLDNFVMEAELLYELENLIVDADSSEHEQITADWVADNQEWVDSLTA